MKSTRSLCRRVLCAVMALALALPMAGQKAEDWTPTGVWPFINRRFKYAVVYTENGKRHKTAVLCNIHVGKSTLWYDQGGTMLEAVPNSVVRVDFVDGGTFIPVGSQNEFGCIVREDSIDGMPARIIHVREVDRRALDQIYVDYLNKSANVLQGASGSFVSALADTQGGRVVEEEPLPMKEVYYFQVKGETFPVSTKNIMNRLPKMRRKEYLRFTRSAEIITSNESSVQKIWKEFFLKEK